MRSLWISIVALTLLSASNYKIVQPGKPDIYLPVMDENTNDLTISGKVSVKNGVHTSGLLTITPATGHAVTTAKTLRPAALQLPSWSTSTSYVAGDVVLRGGTIYIARDAHTSGSVFGTDWITGSHWTTMSPGPGSASAVAGPCPPGTFLADGSSKSRVTYADLYAVVGTAHGAADINSFNLPDYRGRFLRGADATNIVGTVQDDATSKNGLALTGTVTGGTSTITTGTGITAGSAIFGGAIAGGSFAGTFATATHAHALTSSSVTWGSGSTISTVRVCNTTSESWPGIVIPSTPIFSGPVAAVTGVAATATISFTPAASTLSITSTSASNGNLGITTVPASNGNIAIGPGDTETRPINTAVNYCVEY